MQEMIKLGLGILFLLLGIPIGIFLRKRTQDELKSGQKWFKIIILLSLVGGLVGLIIGNDVIFFSLLFVAIVTSFSLKR